MSYRYDSHIGPNHKVKKTRLRKPSLTGTLTAYNPGLKNIMHFSRLSALALLLPCFLAGNALAARQLSQEDLKSAKEAFYFSERNNWQEVLLHARRAKNPLIADYMTWRVLRNSDDGFAFSAYKKFLEDNPSWPDQNRLLIRAENALFSEGVGNYPISELHDWFTRFLPISGKGKIIYGQVLLQKSQRQEAEKWIQDGWIGGDFDTNQEQYILEYYKDYLQQKHHIARIDRLLWEGKTTAATRLYYLIPTPQRMVFEARIALAKDSNGLEGILSRVPSSLQNDPGLLYERMKWRERKGGREDEIRQILLSVTNPGPVPEKWWQSRHIHARKALEDREYNLALNLLDKHGQTNSANLSEALFLQGWIYLTKLKQPGKAIAYFQKLDDTVTYPVSKSRAAYWIARCYASMGQPQNAQQWYLTGASYPTTFYGQLSQAKLKSPLSIPSFVGATPKEKQKFENDRRIQVVQMLAAIGRQKEALTFINHLANEPSNHARASYIADLGNVLGRRDYALIAAKESIKQNIVLPQQGYPYFSLPFNPKGEEALIWAITRQESLFDPQAESAAGAKGLMQLLPSTAKEVARKNDLPFSPATLSDGKANVRLGDAYINQLIRQFDGSYILAIAAYNAGQGRARQWQRQYGDIGKTPEEAVDWIENIPFSETRNYVQRVLENLQVYRVLLPKNKSGGQHSIETDLTRG